MMTTSVPKGRRVGRRLVYVFLSLLVSVVAVAAAAKPMILLSARRQLSRTFPGTQVTIGGAEISLLKRLSLFNIAVRREGVYSFNVGAVAVNYSPASLLKKKILKVSVADARLEVTLPRENITDLTAYINLGSEDSGFVLDGLELTGLSAGVRLKNITFEAKASAAVNIKEKTLDFLELYVPSLTAGKFLLKDAALSLNPGAGPNEFYVPKLQYDKVKADKLHGKVSLKGDRLSAEDISVSVLGGEITGRGEAAAGAPARYRASLEFAGLDLAKAVDAFDLKEKFLMSGWLGGAMELGGSGADLKVLSGSFTMTQDGGTLTVTDPALLKNIAARTGQRMEILVDSFKDYHYNTGMITLSLEDSDLSVGMALEGEAGKRNLNIVVHDLQTKKDGL